MKRKLNFILTCVLTLVVAGSIKAQLNSIGKKLLAGDILFTPENNVVEKKKELKDTKTFTADQAVFATVYVNNMKFRSHNLFFKEEGRLYMKATVSVKGGESIKLEFDLKQDDIDKKFSCFEFIPAVLNPEKENHKKLAYMLGELKPGIYTVTLLADDQNVISGSFDMDLSAGTGRFGEFTKKTKEEEARKAAEEKKIAEAKAAEAKKKAEEEAKKKAAALKAFQSSPDVVKVAFKNKCENPGELYVSTGDNYTSFYMSTLNQGQQSDYVICRPGNKVYLGNEVIHTVSATSKNKVIEFCPPKTEAQLKEENFQTGWESITVTIYNKCSETVNYLVEQGGSTLNTSLGGNASTSSPSMKKGNKIWLSNDKYEKVSLIYEANSYSEKGMEVILCR